MNSVLIEGSMIQIVIHYIDKDGIGRGYRTVSRKAARYQQMGERETVLVRIHGQDLWAERYPNTAWTVEVSK